MNLPLTHCQSPAWTFLQLNISREIRLWLRTDPWTWQVVTSTLSLSPSCNEGLRQIVVSNGSGIVIRLSESQFVFSIRSCWFYFQFLVVPSSDPLPSSLPPSPFNYEQIFLMDDSNINVGNSYEKSIIILLSNGSSADGEKTQSQQLQIGSPVNVPLIYVSVWQSPKCSRVELDDQQPVVIWPPGHYSGPPLTSLAYLPSRWFYSFLFSLSPVSTWLTSYSSTQKITNYLKVSSPSSCLSWTPSPSPSPCSPSPAPAAWLSAPGVPGSAQRS